MLLFRPPFPPSSMEQEPAPETPTTADDVIDELLAAAGQPHIEGTQIHALCEAAAILYKPDVIELPPEALQLAQSIDHTYLTVTQEDPIQDIREVVRVCAEAAAYHFKSVCIRPDFVSLARTLLKYWDAQDTSVCTVIDFPKAKDEIAGTAESEVKSAEADMAQLNGATEFDVVLDYRAILNGRGTKAYEDIAAVCNQVKGRDAGSIVKVIVESALLRRWGGEPALWDGCQAVIDGGADFGKTSTGFAREGGATEEDVRFLADRLHPCGILVKASGGIGDLPTLEAMQKAGADRYGMSKSVKVMQEKLAQMKGQTRT